MLSLLKQVPLYGLIIALGVMQWKLHGYEKKEREADRLEIQKLLTQNKILVETINKQNEFFTLYDDVLQNVQKHPDGPLSPRVASALDGLRDIDGKRKD